MREPIPLDDKTCFVILDYDKYDQLRELFKEHHIWSNEEIHYKLLTWFNSTAKITTQRELDYIKKQVK